MRINQGNDNALIVKLTIGLCFLMIIKASLPPEDDEDNVLHIGAIFPIGGKGGWQGGQVN